MTQTVSAMDRDGIQIETVAWKGTDPRIVEAAEGCGIRVNHLPSRQRDLPGYCRGLSRLMERGGFDMVHVCGSSGLMGVELLLALFVKVPVRICHSHNTSCRHRLLDRALRPIMYACATDFVACGTDAGRWLFGDRRFTVIPNGKDLELYRYDEGERQTVRTELGITTDQVVIGHVGRFNEQKNHAKLLEVFSELRRRSRKYLLVLVGDGALFEDVKGKVARLGLSGSVLFLGFRSDVPKLLNAMDCMVLPSLYEGFPNVVVEWQVNGLPCVISDSVTRECALTPLVCFQPLEASPIVWANAVESALLSGASRIARSRESVIAAIGSGYDIRKSSSKLRAFYLSRCPGNGLDAC